MTRIWNFFSNIGKWFANAAERINTILSIILKLLAILVLAIILVKNPDLQTWLQEGLDLLFH